VLGKPSETSSFQASSASKKVMLPILLASLTAVAVIFVLGVSIDTSFQPITTTLTDDPLLTSNNVQLSKQKGIPVEHSTERAYRDSTIKALSSRICGQPAVDGYAAHHYSAEGT
jgi:hypothetical protein